MIEDLYTGKTTIRQLRRSYIGDEVKEFYELFVNMTGPGIVKDKNYVLMPSGTFVHYLATKYANAMDAQQVMVLASMGNSYSHRYALTMLIND